MKYLMMVKLDRNSEAGRKYDAGNPPDPNLVAAMGKLIGEMAKSGTLIDTVGLLPVAKGAKIRAAGGKMAVTDGPFIESKEVIGGYAMLQVKSKEEALKWGEEFMRIHVEILGPSFAGELEMREISDETDCQKVARS